VELIGYDAPVTWQQKDDALVVDLPARPLGAYPIVVRIR
jgi:hypothetical protein